jgi:hypothetical protein
MVRQAHHERVAASNAAESVTNDAASRVTVSVTAADLPPLDRGDRADIVVAVTEDGLSSDVKRGENRGRTLAHAAVVRQLATIGEATGGGGSAHAELTLAPDWKRERLKLVGFVQERRARAVLAVAAVPLAVVKSQVGSLKSEPKPRSMKNDSAIGFELRRGRLTSDFRLQTSDFSER